MLNFPQDIWSYVGYALRTYAGFQMRLHIASHACAKFFVFTTINRILRV